MMSSCQLVMPWLPMVPSTGDNLISKLESSRLGDLQIHSNMTEAVWFGNHGHCRNPFVKCVDHEVNSCFFNFLGSQ